MSYPNFDLTLSKAGDPSTISLLNRLQHLVEVTYALTRATLQSDAQHSATNNQSEATCRLVQYPLGKKASEDYGAIFVPIFCGERGYQSLYLITVSPLRIRRIH